MSQYFGFELLYSSVKHDLAEKSDLLVVVFHWFLIRENFQCLGVGTERELLDGDNPSELLPTGWNENRETYYLRYFNAEKNLIFVLDVTMSTPQEAVVTIAGEDAVTKGFTLNVQDYLGDIELATNTKTKVQHIMPKIDELMYKFQTLFKQLVPKDSNCKEAATGRVPPTSNDPPPTNPDPTRNRQDLRDRDPLAAFRHVGRGDLDPFHVGGGMLGIGPGRPLGNVRYDPVGPIPIHDHFRPPGRSGFPTDPDDLLNLNPNRGPNGPGQGMFQPPGPGGSGSFDWYG